MIPPKVSTEYSMITWRNGRACTAHAHRKYLSPCVLQVSYNVLTNRPDNVSLSLWMNMTKPMLQAIGNEELQKYFRNTLKPFIGALKVTKDGCIKLGFLTGVTKFGKVSVFSDLNNLIDISMDEQYVELCGITEKESMIIWKRMCKYWQANRK